jgi:hypothetical protein
VAVEGGLNAAYYKPGTNPVDILVRRNVSNPDADALRKAVAALHT